MRSIKRIMTCAIAGTLLVSSALAGSATVAEASQENGSASPNTSSWVREGGTSGNCAGQQVIVEGYNGSVHEYQYGELTATGPGNCAMWIQQTPTGAYAQIFIFSGGATSSKPTPTWYDGPGYTDQVCVQDEAPTYPTWCSTAY